jgi:tetratricopeptide (TPR) repeat protein/transcriptional regulator with XRE-family HTH domain
LGSIYFSGGYELGAGTVLARCPIRHSQACAGRRPAATDVARRISVRFPHNYAVCLGREDASLEYVASTEQDRTVGALVRTFRRTAGLSQEELAERAGLSVEAISAIERGARRRPHPRTLRALASALGLPAGDRASLFGAAPVEGLADLLPTAPQVRHTLPADTVAFTGRGGELSQIMAAVAGTAGAGGVVAVGAVAGMPGVGKTALAVHAAHVLAAEFPDRRLFVDLHAHTPGHEPMRPEDALAGLLAAVGVEPRCLPSDLEERAALWRDRMAGQRALLVLDNAASSRQVVPLLPGGGCLVLVTSRRHLGDLPGAVTQLPLDVMTPGEAADMFTRLAPRSAGDHDGVAEVVALAGFLPLAVRLLARVFARHPSWTLADLAGETRRGVLTLTVENDSVAAAFEVSYRHLDPDSQRLFRLLGVHPGTVIDGYAAAALAGVRQDEAARLLDGLHREGLVTEAGYRRYGMHDLLRRYTRDVAAADNGTADNPATGGQALGRLLDYYQHTASLADEHLAHQARPGPRPPAPAAVEVPVLEDATSALAWIRAERASLLACLDLAARTGQHARVIALTAGLAALLRRDGPWAEAVVRHTAAIDAARRLGDRLSEASALTDLGDVRQVTNDYPGAARALEQALGIYRDLGDRLGQANALHSLGDVQWLTDDYPGAARALEQALGIYRDLGDRLGQANALRDLGDVRRITGDYPGAAEALEQALGIYRVLSDLLGEANACDSLGAVRRLTGDYPGAAHVLEQALAIYRDLGSRLGQANALRELGDVRRTTGDPLGAAHVLEQALGIYRDIGNRLGEANARKSLGAVQGRRGDYRGADEAVGEALGIYRDLGDRQGEAEALNEQGTLHRLRGDLNRARECHQQALDLARAIGSSHDEAQALASLGRCAMASGSTAQAGDLLRQAHEIFQRIGAAQARDVLAELDNLTCPGPGH